MCAALKAVGSHQKHWEGQEAGAELSVGCWHGERGGGQVSGSHANTQLMYCNQDMQEDHPGCSAHPPAPALPQI